MFVAAASSLFDQLADGSGLGSGAFVVTVSLFFARLIDGSGFGSGVFVFASSSLFERLTDGSCVFTGAVTSFFGVLGTPLAEGAFADSTSFGLSANGILSVSGVAAAPAGESLADFAEPASSGLSIFDSAGTALDATSDGAETCKDSCLGCISSLVSCFTAVPSLFLFGFRASVFLGGLLVACTLSCVLLAELAVGFIILAMKPPSTGVVDGRLPLFEEVFVDFVSVSYLLAELAVGRIILDKKSPSASEGLFVDVRVDECSADALPEDVEDGPSWVLLAELAVGFIILEKKSPSDVRGFTGFVGDFGLTAWNVSFTVFLAVEVLGAAVFGEETFGEDTLAGPGLGLIVELVRESFG